MAAKPRCPKTGRIYSWRPGLDLQRGLLHTIDEVDRVVIKPGDVRNIAYGSV